MTTAYAPPLDLLLSLGEISWNDRQWRDFRALGFREEHGPALARLLADPAVVDDVSDEGMWTVVHAWRAAGQLGAVEAVEPLIRILRGMDDDDWIGEEVPVVLARIGPPALPMLVEALPRAARREAELWGAVGLARAMRLIAGMYPETRDEVAAALARQLELHAEQDGYLNGFLVSYLVDLEATEAAPRMEAAFAEDSVFTGIGGDWEDVQVKLGLLSARVTPHPRFAPLGGWGADDGGVLRGRVGADAEQARAEARSREKAAKRKKAEKKARKGGKRGRAGKRR
jgi:hypothetical protein